MIESKSIRITMTFLGIALVLLFLYWALTHWEGITYGFKYKTKVFWTKYEMKKIGEEVVAHYALKSRRLPEDEFPLWVADFGLSRGKPADHDHFGNPYYFAYDMEGFLLQSGGPDGEFDTKDDLKLAIEDMKNPDW